MKFEIPGRPLPLSRPFYGKKVIFDKSKKDKQNFALQCKYMAPFRPLEGVLSLDLEFYFKRPKSHYRTGKNSHLIKDKFCEYHVNVPDLSNLIKFVEDALIGLFYKDDRQIAIINAVKYYCNEKHTEEKTIIRIRQYG